MSDEKCPDCLGMKTTPDGLYHCVTCNGTGKKEEKLPIKKGQYWECPCGAMNKDYEHTCDVCGGKRDVDYKQKYEEGEEKRKRRDEMLNKLEEDYNKDLEDKTEKIQQLERKNDHDQLTIEGLLKENNQLEKEMKESYDSQQLNINGKMKAIDELKKELEEWKLSEKETRHCLSMEYKNLRVELEGRKKVVEEGLDELFNNPKEKDIVLSDKEILKGYINGYVEKREKEEYLSKPEEGS